jgi:hypothetical protein
VATHIYRSARQLLDFPTPYLARITDFPYGSMVREFLWVDVSTYICGPRTFLRPLTRDTTSMIRNTGIALLVTILFSSTYAHFGRIPGSVPPKSAPVARQDITPVVPFPVVAKAPTCPVSFPNLDFGRVLPGHSSERRISFFGAKLGSEVVLSVPSGAAVDGARFISWVSAKGEITVRYINNSSTAQNPGGGQVYRVRLK